MSREEHARAGAQAVIPDDTIVDVAVVMPRGSTFATVLGAAAGASAGSAMGNPTAWGVAGGMVGQRALSATKGSYPSIVLAASADHLYVLGRRSTGLVGGWKHLHPIAQIERRHLAVARSHHGTVPVIELTDTTTGTTLEFEAAHIGTLGIKDFLASLDG